MRKIAPSSEHWKLVAQRAQYYKLMDLNRRGFLLWASAPLLARPLRQHVDQSGLGEVYFCRVSDARLLPIARSIYPLCIASHEPRPGFHGITFCGAMATLTVAPDRLS